MPLTWSIKNVQDCDSLVEDQNEEAVTQSLVFFSMVIESGGITVDNAADWAAVLALYQRLHGALMTVSEDGVLGDYFIGTADVLRRVGMRTNAGGLGTSQIRKHGKRLAADYMTQVRNAAEREIDSGA